MIAIGRRDKTPALPQIQRMLAHEPADILGVRSAAAPRPVRGTRVCKEAHYGFGIEGKGRAGHG